MRISRFVKLFVGPILAGGLALFVLAWSVRSRPVDAQSLIASVMLFALMSAGIVATVMTRVGRRQIQSALEPLRCPCCGNPMRGIVDGQRGPEWCCVECMRRDTPLPS